MATKARDFYEVLGVGRKAMDKGSGRHTASLLGNTIPI